MSLQSNVATTKAVMEYIALGEDIAREHDVRRFWTAVQAMAADRGGNVTKDGPVPHDRLQPMTEHEAKQFENRKVGYGKYADTTWADVPVDYLAWIAEHKRADLGYTSLKVQLAWDAWCEAWCKAWDLARQ